AVPQPRFEAPVEYRAPSPAQVSKPAFKGSGMKLGKKGKQSDLISALGGEADLEPEPIHQQEAQPKVEKVESSIHITIKEQLSITMARDGGVQNFELKGDLDLRITEATLAKLQLTLAPKDYSELQFKQHPNVAKFTGSEKIIALKDASRSFPVGQGLGVLRWRMTSKDESNVPLSNGSCDVAIEYELEASHLALRNVVISIPIPPNSLPSVTGDADWRVDRSAFIWTIDTVDAENPTGSLEFKCEGDADSFFPVNVGFVAAGSVANVDVVKATLLEGGEERFSQEKILTVDKYEIV
ncbi:coatomer subunit delta, partial [Tremellales sp. Uapishka_1]